MVRTHDARTALRSATRDAHDRVDRLFSAADLSARPDYGRFLLAQAAAYLPVEDALTRSGADGVTADWSQRMRGALLRADLDAFGLSEPTPLPCPLFSGRSAMLGAIYVLEGSRLGGQMLVRRVPPDLPTAFLGSTSTGSWPRLLTLIEHELAAPALREEAIAAAIEVFGLFEAAARRFMPAERVA